MAQGRESGDVLEPGRNDFCGLPRVRPLHLQAGKGAETGWLRGRKPLGMSEVNPGPPFMCETQAGPNSITGHKQGPGGMPG